MYEPQGPNTGGGPGSSGDDGSLDPSFSCRVTETDGRVRVDVVGELDLAAAPEFERQLELLLARAPLGLTLDLAGMTFLDSSGVGALCRAQDLATRQDIELHLASVPEHARRVLEITGLTGLFRLE